MFHKNSQPSSSKLSLSTSMRRTISRMQTMKRFRSSHSTVSVLYVSTLRSGIWSIWISINSTMKFTEFQAGLRFQTWTNDYTLSTPDIVALSNIELDTFGLLWSVPWLNEDLFGKIYTRDLTVGNRKYEIPFDLIHVKKLEVCMTWLATDWKEAKETNIGTNGMITQEANILAMMNGRDPLFEMFGGYLYLYSSASVIAVTGWIKMHGIMYPSSFNIDDFWVNDRDISVPRDATTQGIPRAFHKLLLQRISIAYKQSRDKPIPLTESEQMHTGNLADVISNMRLYNYSRKHKMSNPNDGYSKNPTFDPLSYE